MDSPAASQTTICQLNVSEKKKKISQSGTQISVLWLYFALLVLLAFSVMAPVPEFQPLKPIQDNWESIKPWQEGYMTVLNGLGTVFGFAAAVALVVGHKFQLPKWPFNKERWNPKPTAEKKEEEKAKEEVSEDQIMEDELAEVVGALGKREFLLSEEWYDADIVGERTAHLSKRDGILPPIWPNILDNDFSQRAGNGTEKIIEDGKSGFDKIKEEFGDLVETAEEVGKDIWNDIKGIWEHDDKESDNQNGANATESTASGNATNTRESSSRRFI
jgi:hypothetical protein